MKLGLCLCILTAVGVLPIATQTINKEDNNSRIRKTPIVKQVDVSTTKSTNCDITIEENTEWNSIVSNYSNNKTNNGYSIESTFNDDMGYSWGPIVKPNN